jgi:hypothetical protein
LTRSRGADYARNVVPLLRALFLCLTLAPLLTAPAQAERPRPGAAQAAAKAFERGQKLYVQGKYLEAIAAFEEAHRLAPHASALFNIGRCYESMGRSAQAVEQYERALKAAPEAGLEADLRARIGRLRAEPVRVFVSSEPAGARVTVDGARAPEPGQTPIVVKLAPGEHVLILEHKGYHLTTRRVEVEMAKEQPVQVVLRPLPRPCPPPPPPCPPPPAPCPELRMLELDGLHVHLSVTGTFGFTPGRPLAAGPGFAALISFRRWIFGGHVAYFPGEEVKIDPLTAFGVTFDRIRPRWVIGQVEVGRAFPFRTFFLYTTVGLGVSADRIVFLGNKPGPKLGEIVPEDAVREEAAFVWSVGGGIQAFATRWLSLGVSLRFGVAHGTRSSKENPNVEDDSHTFPYGTIAGVTTFHL